MNGFNVARHQPSHHKYVLFWFEIACLQSTQIAKLLWPKSSNFGTFIQPTYRMEWWHLGGPLLLPRSGPQASCMSTKNKPDKPELALIQNTHESTASLPKKARIWFVIFGPYSVFYMWAISGSHPFSQARRSPAVLHHCLKWPTSVCYLGYLHGTLSKG